jgi:two-component system sensor histidine kinase/response regulator
MAHYNDGMRPIDLQEALNRAMGEKEFLAMLLEEFIAGLAEQIEALRASIDRQDDATLVKLSHTIKGAAGTLSAKALADSALRLEAAGRAADFQNSSSLVDAMAKEVDRLRDYWEEIDWSRVN